MITHSDLKQRLTYNPDTGIFLWIDEYRCAGKGIDRPAGTINKNGYAVISISGKKYKAHRLAWFYHYGKWPKHDIDHLNQVKTDNRISNLRDVDHASNMQNSTVIRKNNTTGYPGVIKAAGSNRYTAVISLNGKSVNLGTYDTAYRAHVAYMDAKKKHHNMA